MLDNGKLAERAASFKRLSQREFDKAVRELVALAFKYAKAGAGFLWDMEPELNDEANRILRDLSDELADKAKEIARAIVEDMLDEYDFEEAWEQADDAWDVPLITRLDQQGSFLKELLEIWVAIAFVNHMTQGELRVEVSRYLANPFASPLWRGIPADALAWGRGYSKDIAGQIAVIGQNSIIAATRLAEWMDAGAKGADYYIRRRGSWYDCPECDSMCGYPIPIATPFEFAHSRCMCWPEYHFIG